MAVPWMEFGPEAFELARNRRKPLLLCLAPRWSQAARSFLQSKLKDPRVDALINGGFVPVFVDSERRPDVSARYEAGGWPSIAALTPDGDAFAAEPGPSDLAGFLARAKEAFVADPEGVSARLASARREADRQEAGFELKEELDPDFPRRTLEGLKFDFDPGRGRFRHGPKGPAFASLELLLYAAAEWRDPDAASMLRRALSEMSDGGLRDRAEGGFFAGAAERDGTIPVFEKRLADNARLGRLYLDAASVVGEPSYLEVAAETIGWLKLTLHDAETGTFYSSQFADEATASPNGARRRSAAYELDRTVFADANAAVVPLLLKAACLFPERGEEFEELATKVLSALETRFFDHHDGMLHYMDGAGPARQPGLLSDQAWAMLAFTEAFQQFMDREYRDFADELLRITLRIEWYREKAGFFDREPAEGLPGPLSRPLLPFGENAVALEALWRLGEMKGIPNYSRWLRMAFMNLIPRVDGRPHEAAPYARLFDIFTKGRLELDLIGRPEDAGTRSLLAQVKRLYLPRAVVSFIDPDDMDFILAHRLTGPRTPRLFVIAGGRSAGSGETIGEIETVLRALP